MRLGLFSPLRRPKWPSASEMAKPTGNENNEGYFIVLNNIFEMTISVSRVSKFWDECYCGRHHLCAKVVGPLITWLQLIVYIFDIFKLKWCLQTSVVFCRRMKGLVSKEIVVLCW